MKTKPQKTTKKLKKQHIFVDKTKKKWYYYIVNKYIQT